MVLDLFAKLLFVTVLAAATAQSVSLFEKTISNALGRIAERNWTCHKIP